VIFLKRLIDQIAYLASSTIQERHVLGEAMEDYLTPDDLINDFLGSLAFFRDDRFPGRIIKLEEHLGSSSYNNLLALEKLIRDNPSLLDGYTRSNLAALVHDDPVWTKMRDAAAQILQELNFDLKHWEKENA
jgi:hypothetical protein